MMDKDGDGYVTRSVQNCSIYKICILHTWYDIRYDICYIWHIYEYIHFRNSRRCAETWIKSKLRLPSSDLTRQANNLNIFLRDNFFYETGKNCRLVFASNRQICFCWVSSLLLIFIWLRIIWQNKQLLS